MYFIASDGCYAGQVLFFSLFFGKWLACSRLRQKSDHFLPDEADFIGRSSRYGQKNGRSMAENGPFGARQRAI
jgi:hypothetical protein